MNWWIVGVIAVVIVLAVLAAKFGWIDLSNKTRSTGGSSSSIVGIGDEVFAPTRHEAQVELDRQSMLPAPAPLAGDGDKGIWDGKIQLDLGAQGRGQHVEGRDVDHPGRDEAARDDVL
ncbi:hypothetical protein [Leifsonia sp. NPDC058230]|uniref:hypothetical protein n=1 Tax=Leifsonia sp. NPDC058230 TaxID=3346391 RepID=UPI0036DEE30B